ncbi:MAG: DMT family transporter [Bacteroidetes bacterium]|nr:DMT family transporter [Bacteroidota bacterium]
MNAPLIKKNATEAWLLLAVLSLIWGSSFILIKRGLLVFSPPEVASMRLTFSGLVMLPAVLMNLKKVSWQEYRFILLFGVMNAGIPPFLFAYAQVHLPSSTAGVLNALTPLFTLVMGKFLFSLHFNFWKIMGVFLGLLGACIIIFLKPGNNLFAFYSPAVLLCGLMVVIADLLYGTSNNINMVYLKTTPPLLIPAFALVSMAVPASIYLVGVSDFTHKIMHVDGAMQSAGYIFLLAAFGSALAMLLFSKLIKISNALFASFITYLLPFVSLMWGFLDGETIGIVQILGLAIIIGGIWISRKE